MWRTALPRASSSRLSLDYIPRTPSRVNAPRRLAHTARLTPTPSDPFRSLPPFRPPPIHQRLRPLIPFFIAWSIITSLAVHLLRQRIRAQEDLDRHQAQITVLEDLIGRLRGGEGVDAEEVQRALEMVGLRERKVTRTAVEEEMGEMRNVGWREVILGRRRKEDKGAKVDDEEAAMKEWAQVVNEASKAEQPPTRPSATPTPERAGVAQRASSATAYL